MKTAVDQATGPERDGGGARRPGLIGNCGGWRALSAGAARQPLAALRGGGKRAMALALARLEGAADPRDEQAPAPPPFSRKMVVEGSTFRQLLAELTSAGEPGTGQAVSAETMPAGHQSQSFSLRSQELTRRSQQLVERAGALAQQTD